jgi:nitroreductase
MTMTPFLDDPLAALNQRLSIPARQLGEPGPNAEQLDQLLSAAVRVPDHGKLTPWRMLLVRGDDRIRLGERLADIHLKIDPEISPSKLTKDRERYTFAPLIVVVIARLDAEHPKVPAQEQILSAGCVAYNLLIGAQALGFAAQWLTGWAAYDADAAVLFGLGENEHVVAFVHIGTPQEQTAERTRPLLADVVSEWHA